MRCTLAEPDCSHDRCSLRHPQVERVRGVQFHAQGIVSAKGLRGAGANFTTLESGMAVANVTWIDVLKIDIEGGEWGVFLELLDGGAQMPFTQVLIEIHSNIISGGPAGPTAKRILTRFFTGMHAAGYRVFSVEPNYLAAQQCIEYTFVKVDDSGQFIRGM
jgi:Methyltransferase domain